jgi:hypothetical protein
MAETTYHELFQQALEEKIGAYGNFWEIVNLVSVYKGWDPETRHDAFLGWIESAAFSCGRCGRPFTLKHDEVSEDWAVVCRRCARS